MDLKYLFLFVTILHGVHGLRCLSCQGVIEPRACLHKQECGVAEICYTEQVIDDDLTTYYNVGCRSRQLCDMEKVAFGKRSGELQVCQKCCNTDKCNNQACQHSQGASANICSRCQDVASPLECQSLVECRSDEICFTQQFVNDNFEKRYNLGCEKKKRCELLSQLVLHHRNVQLCNKCCQGSECNKKLCIEMFNTPTPPEIKTNSPTAAAHTTATTFLTTTSLPITTTTSTTTTSPTTTTAPTTTTTPASTTTPMWTTTPTTTTMPKTTTLSTTTTPMSTTTQTTTKTPTTTTPIFKTTHTTTTTPTTTTSISTTTQTITTTPTTTTPTTTYTSSTTTTSRTTITTMAKTTSPTSVSKTLSNTQEKPTQPVCVDFDVRCNSRFYQQILCASKDPSSISLAISTCPKTCNRCDEYFAQQTTLAPQTVAVVATKVTTAQPTCSDQSPKCIDHLYTTFLCANLDPIHLEYTIATCPKSCNRCAEYYVLQARTTTPVPLTTTTVVGTTTPLECIDREAKCSDKFYQSILCTATDQFHKDYALQTCPKACNLCDELLGSIGSAFGR